MSVFSPNTGKCGPEITLYLDTFHAVVIMRQNFPAAHQLFECSLNSLSSLNIQVKYRSKVWMTNTDRKKWKKIYLQKNQYCKFPKGINILPLISWIEVLPGNGRYDGEPDKVETTVSTIFHYQIFQINCHKINSFFRNYFMIALFCLKL